LSKRPLPTRIALVSLGCPKNLVDSEYICEQLREAGYEIVPDTARADTVVVNTCSFLTSAVEESVQTMLELMEEGKQVICAGCMVSRYGSALLDELPEVRLFAAPGTYANLATALGEGSSFLSACFDGVVSRRQATTGGFAYVKVSEGCSNHCAYCLIPSIRGELVSKPVKDVVSECRDLARSGVKEVVLVAQDLGSYGADLGRGASLPKLLEKIARVEGIEWIRLMYMHPATFTEAVVKAMNEIPVVVPYIDLPIQHVSGKVLAAMGRKGGADAVRRAFELLKTRAPEVWVRSTVMVGHPGEDRQAFAELEEFISQGNVDHLGVFAYSPEEGTRSASLRDAVPRKTKQGRVDRIMSLQQEVSRRRLQSLVGRTLRVLVEGYHPETELLLKGRSEFQAPEVDGHVIINEGQASFGSFSEVEITEAMEYDLVGRIT
jgi:ribosomal protein S12 methylthiotransferase